MNFSGYPNEGLKVLVVMVIQSGLGEVPISQLAGQTLGDPSKGQDRNLGLEAWQNPMIPMVPLLIHLEESLMVIG